MRAAFFKGCRLWERFEAWSITSSRQDSGGSVGARREYGTRYGGAPNWRRDITVRCMVPEVTAISDLDQADTLDNVIRRMDERLIVLSQTTGDLCRCADRDRKADVSASASKGSGVTVSHGTPGGSWTPTTGRYVLFRNPATRAGFVAAITATGSGTITVDVLDEDITTAWDILDVQAYYPDVHYIGPVQAGMADLGAQTHRWRPSIEYAFESYSDSLNATAHDVDMDD